MCAEGEHQYRSTVVRVNAVRATKDVSRAWRVRQWPGDATVAHLIFTDHLVTPTASSIEQGLEHARRRGARAVRTSALFPRAADVALAAGFEPIDRLALLRLDLDESSELVARSRRHPRPLYSWQYGRAAKVDQEAFGPLWGNNRDSLAEIRDATPVHRGRYIGSGRDMAGFAIAGAAGSSGYLQRLATAPAHRRTGVARDLVADAAGWMRERGLETMMVNTGVANGAALALYEGLGFTRLDEQLTIAELRFSG